jgi:uncharacterized membrane protein
MNRIAIGRWLALIGLFGLMILLLNWFTWLAPVDDVPRSLMLILLVVPLLLPMRGILHARPYTHAWAGYLAMFYFLVGVEVAFNQPDERALGWLTILFSLSMLVGCGMYARFGGRALKQELAAQAAEKQTADEKDGEAAG